MKQQLEIADQDGKTMSELTGKYLTFALAGEEYGISILKVKEIIGVMAVTSVPQTPDFVKGVINLRGKVIPVVDLRLKFGLNAIEYDDRTCIIVVEVGKAGSYIRTGIVVDTVSEVLNIKDGETDTTPEFGTGIKVEFILGIAKISGGVKILLDIDRILNTDELIALKDVA